LTDLAAALADAGGAAAPASATAHLRTLLADELRAGREELALKRSGYERPVTVAVAATPDGLLAAAPVDPALRADPDAVSERAWLLVAALVGALVELAGPGPPRDSGDLRLTAGGDGFLCLAYPAAGQDPTVLDELVPLAFEEQAGGIDRLRARALAVPGALLEETDLRPPIGDGHPLRIAEAVARLGGHPADPEAVDALGDALVAVVAPAGAAVRPHEDPDPARRIARRILQRLNGMGKWGGYHTEFSHLPRGFAGNERALAIQVGEALLAAGLLEEKPSVGQRHVFLNPRRAGDIHRLIETGEAPADLSLPK
jgi:hypothetical protein